MRETYSVVLYHPLLHSFWPFCWMHPAIHGELKLWAAAVQTLTTVICDRACCLWVPSTHTELLGCPETPGRDTSPLRGGKRSATSAERIACRDQGEMLPEPGASWQLVRRGRSISPLCFKVWLICVGNPLLNNSEWCRNRHCVIADGSSGFLAGSKSAKTCQLRTDREHRQS